VKFSADILHVATHGNDELRASKRYRGFESLLLRYPVLTAAKSRRNFLRNERVMPEFRDYSSTDWTPENGLLGSESQFLRSEDLLIPFLDEFPLADHAPGIVGILCNGLCRL
jgi:hypothetical protein